MLLHAGAADLERAATRALWRNMQNPIGFLVSGLETGKTPIGSPIYFTRHLFDGQVISIGVECSPPANVARHATAFDP
jgi:hypothetical protein